jgi:hypothetical protein
LSVPTPAQRQLAFTDHYYIREFVKKHSTTPFLRVRLMTFHQTN